MKTTLLIMAAGIGSRFGEGIKQLEPVGMHDEIIMDYSIHDAIAAGFNKIVFIIREDIEADFMERIGNRIEKICKAKGIETAYAFQNIKDIPGDLPKDRTKPWGTGQAVLAAKDLIKEPFLVINADDYYGKEAYTKMHDWLCKEHKPNDYAMAGFILKNTLSENGGVTRGICQVKDNFLVDVVETSNIEKTATGAAVGDRPVDPESYVSMNMWGLTPAYMDVLTAGFKTFFTETVPTDPLKAEYLLPNIIGEMLRNKECSVEVLETQDKWFGVTYKEDKELVVNSFKKLIEDGEYREELYGDL